MFGDFTKNYQKFESANADNHHCKDCRFFLSEKNECARYNMGTTRDKWCKAFKEKEDVCENTI